MKPIACKLDHFPRFLLAVFFVFSAYLLIFPQGEFCSIMVPPDCMEYVFCMDNFAKYNEFSIKFNETLFPSRYAPWFSMIFLYPAYFFSGFDLSIIKYVMGGYGVVTLFLFYLVGKRLKSKSARWLTLCLVLLNRDFITYSRMTMTEVPYLMMLLVLLLWSLRMLHKPMLKRMDFLIAGTLTMLCGAVRSTGLPMLLFIFGIAFVREPKWCNRIKYCVIASLPVILYEIANAFFNYGVFGSVFRSGYNFWMPIPYDIPELVFNVDYIWHNVYVFAQTCMFWIILTMLAVCTIHSLLVYRGKFGGCRQHPSFCPAFLFIDLQFIILCAIYLPYYWDDTRFFFFMPLMLFPLTIVALQSWLEYFFKNHRTIIFPLLCIVTISVGLLLREEIFGATNVLDQARKREIEIRELSFYRDVVPEKTCILSSASPPIAEKWFVNGHDSYAFPVIRRNRLEYSTAMTAPKSIDDIIPRPNRDTPRLVPDFIRRGICFLPIEHALSDGDDICRMMFERGYRVFICGAQYERVNDETRAYIDSLLSRYGLHAEEFARLPETKSTKYNSFRYRLDRFILRGDSMINDVLPKASLYEIKLANNSQVTTY